MSNLIDIILCYVFSNQIWSQTIPLTLNFDYKPIKMLQIIGLYIRAKNC